MYFSLTFGNLAGSYSRSAVKRPHDEDSNNSHRNQPSSSSASSKHGSSKNVKETTKPVTKTTKTASTNALLLKLICIRICWTLWTWTWIKTTPLICRRWNPHLPKRRRRWWLQPLKTSPLWTVWFIWQASPPMPPSRKSPTWLGLLAKSITWSSCRAQRRRVRRDKDRRYSSTLWLWLYVEWMEVLCASHSSRLFF